jgi:SAM-dependent methyltransferase
MSLDRAAFDRVEQILASPLSERQKLEQTFRALAKWRSQLLGQTMVHHHGTAIQDGPFAGMTYLAHPSEGGVTAKLLGAYEACLQPFFASLPQRGYDAVLNVGCAEGYYAIGCARLLPGTPVLAWDIDPRARQMCAELASLNAVEGQIDLREAFEPGQLLNIREELKGRSGREPHALLVMDCEGAEFDLLDPTQADYGWLDMVVEVHPDRESTVAMLANRFRDTHEIEIKQAETIVPELPDWLQRLGHLDQLLTVWEWRAVPTPWLILTSRNRQA